MLDKKLSSLSEVSKAQLSKVLNSCSGTKDLILESIIIKPLERVCGIRWLKANNVEKIFKLEDEIPSTPNPVFFLIYSNYVTYRKILKMIKEKIGEVGKDKFHIIIVPKIAWQPISLDKGVISLEIPQLYKTLYVHQDWSFLPVIAKSLWHLSFVVGKPRLHLALGPHSTATLRQLDLLYENLPNTDKLEADCGAVILLDRSIDYTSALLTPSTYSALLNEVYGVTCGMCEYKSGDVNETHDNKFNPIIKKEPVQIVLDGNHDPVYRDIKHRYFAEVTEILRSLTRSLKTEGESSREMALDEIKKYVSTQLQATASKTKFIANHLAAAQTIVNSLGHRFESQQETEQFLLQNKNKSGNYSFLEEILCTENNIYISLRLMCLMCLTQELSDSEMQMFWNKFLHEFGYCYGFVPSNLAKAGFLSDEVASSSSLPNIVSKLPRLLSKDFYVNASKLKQMPSDPSKVNLKSPTCCSYVFGGNYIPLITQIASMVLANTPINEIKAKLEPLGSLSIRNENGYPIQPRTVIVYVIGGVTYSEIAACNLLESMSGSKIIVCSDRVISGNDIIESLISLS
ncbi:hypothetical protein FQR65_LT15016 [Abscondita terminalis]|nr:hypothetical protein FQR65_LT15016 [Abscondita terminalis]